MFLHFYSLPACLQADDTPIICLHAMNAGIATAALESHHTSEMSGAAMIQEHFCSYQELIAGQSFATIPLPAWSSQLISMQHMFI